MSEYRVEFDSMGGYDCLSAAYRIKAGSKTIAVLDMADYTQAPVGSREYLEAQQEAQRNAGLFAQSAALLAELETAANRLEDCERETVLSGGTVKLRPFKRWAQEARAVIAKAQGR
jgi:hypothetical protein